MNHGIVRVSKKLSWLLRHGAGECGLVMDAAGWASVADVLAALDLTPEELQLAVERINKGRLQLDCERIRACQGHSLQNMPVTRDALEASWRRLDVAHTLWHGTNSDAIESIAIHGIQPMQRTHVHLAAHSDSHVGKRASVDLLLEVSTHRLSLADVGVFEAPNGVILVRSVPPDCVIGVHAQSKRGRASQDNARHQLGLR